MLSIRGWEGMGRPSELWEAMREFDSDTYQFRVSPIQGIPGMLRTENLATGMHHPARHAPMQDSSRASCFLFSLFPSQRVRLQSLLPFAMLQDMLNSKPLFLTLPTAFGCEGENESE